MDYLACSETGMCPDIRADIPLIGCVAGVEPFSWHVLKMLTAHNIWISEQCCMLFHDCGAITCYPEGVLPIFYAATYRQFDAIFCQLYYGW